jgi:hypothetical protein
MNKEYSMDMQDMDYIGDGVYVGHDGYQIWLTTGSHENQPLVALDPDVLAALNRYYQRVFGK